MKIYIVDHIGSHCGVHYYTEAFKECISQIEDVNVEILSIDVQKSQKKPFFVNQYTGNIAFKILKLFVNLVHLLFFMLTHRKSHVVYLTFGNYFEPIFLRIISLVPKHVIDIHEVVLQQGNAENNIFLKNSLRYVYKNCIKNIISHSSRTDEVICKFGYSGNVFKVPHFKYCFQKDYNLSLINSDVINSIDQNKINLLFFGRLTYDKGIDTFVESINNLSENVQSRINVVIAGRNLDDSIFRVKIQNESNVNLLMRHISDDELIYLYKFCDYIMMPYRVSSQSGILEMAFYFKKPIITSSVPYFKLMLSEFSSFGHLSDGIDASSYTCSIENAILERSSHIYFNDTEYDKYTNRKEIIQFANKFKQWIECDDIKPKF